MKYTVVWVTIAEEELAALWLETTARSEMTAASHWIDRLLSWDPDRVGEYSFDTVRTLSVPPLGVDFEVSIDDRLVYVLSVWDLANPPV